MSPFLVTLVVCLCAAEPDATTGRRYHEIEREISAAMKRESSAKDLTERGAAVRQLAALFTEVDRDPRTPTSVYLQEYRGKVRSRLFNTQTELKHHILRAQRAAKSKGKVNTPASDVLLVEDDQREMAAHVAAQVSLASYASGGPSQVFTAAGGASGGGMIRGDHGEELVELIQTTIAPRAWEANGGPCTIMYYRPLMCLVVRATGDTHRDVDGLLNALRK